MFGKNPQSNLRRKITFLCLNLSDFSQICLEPSSGKHRKKKTTTANDLQCCRWRWGLTTWVIFQRYFFVLFYMHCKILSIFRQGSLKYEKSKEDPFCVVRKRLLKFQEQMSVVVVVWRDCQQLIENYCQEEVKVFCDFLLYYK